MRFVLALLCVVPSTLWACIWDSDTLRDEAHIQGTDTFNLITGQFAHHGRVYHEFRVSSTMLALMTAPNGIDRLNDLGVARLKLGLYDEAIEVFTRIDAMQPDRYETLSNLGVLHKKRGDFDQAAAYTRRALSIRPEGHLGLGDYYLMAIEYRRQPPTADEAYRSYLGRTAPDEKRLEAMIRSDRRFPDALVAYGDLLEGRFDLNHALWAYARALQLGHPQPKAVHAKIDRIFEHWREAVDHEPRGRRVEGKETALKRITRRLEKADAWLTSFEQVEGELIQACNSDEERATVDFAAVEKELDRRGIARVAPVNAGIVDGGEAPQMLAWIFVLAVVLMTTVVLVFRRR